MVACHARSEGRRRGRQPACPGGSLNVAFSFGQVAGRIPAVPEEGRKRPKRQKKGRQKRETLPAMCSKSRQAWHAAVQAWEEQSPCPCPPETGSGGRCHAF